MGYFAKKPSLISLRSRDGFCRDKPSDEKIPVLGIKIPKLKIFRDFRIQIPIPEILSFRDSALGIPILLAGFFHIPIPIPGFRDFSIKPIIKNPDPKFPDRDSGSRKKPIPKPTLLRSTTFC